MLLPRPHGACPRKGADPDPWTQPCPPPRPAPPLTFPAAAQFSAGGKKSFKAKVKQKPPELFLTIWLFWGRHSSRTAAGLPLSPPTRPAGGGPGPPRRALPPDPGLTRWSRRPGGILGINGCVAPGSHARPRARGSGRTTTAEVQRRGVQDGVAAPGALRRQVLLIPRGGRAEASSHLAGPPGPYHAPVSRDTGAGTGVRRGRAGIRTDEQV